MAHFNVVISQNAKWGHAGFYIEIQQLLGHGTQITARKIKLMGRIW